MTAVEPPEPAATLNVPSVPSGARFGRLTRFGSLWLDLDAIQAIDFAPSDGCGFELTIAGECSHFSDIPARDSLRKYLEHRAVPPSPEPAEVTAMLEQLERDPLVVKGL